MKVDVSNDGTRYTVTTVRVDEGVTGESCAGCGRALWRRDGVGGFVLLGMLDGVPLLQVHYRMLCELSRRA